MKRKLSQDELIELHHAETAHGEHVATLALRLFDALAGAGLVARSLRRLLEAACRLHDVGFGLDPVRHPYRSARIIMESGLDGFTARQRAIVAGTVILHSGDWVRAQYSRPISSGAVRRAVLKLGAILRVADGLDRGHIQDARIRAISIKGGCIRVRIVSDGYWRNAERANIKADLWRAVFPIGVRFESRRNPKVVHYRGVISRRDSALAAARRVLSFEYRLAMDAAGGAIAGSDPEALHDLRVALRRYREGLRFFKRVLVASNAESIRGRVGRFCRRLGNARDVQVGARLIERLALRSGRGRWEALVREQRRQMREMQKPLRRILQDRQFARLCSDMQRFVRAGIALLESKGRWPLFRAMASRRVWKGYRNLVRDAEPRKDWDASAFHEFRKKCKRVRYWAEFGSPVLGNRCVELAGKLKSVTSVLGDLHDLDVQMERKGLPGRLRRTMRRKRRKVRREFLALWKRAGEGAFRRSLQRALKGSGD